MAGATAVYDDVFVLCGLEKTSVTALAGCSNFAILSTTTATGLLLWDESSGLRPDAFIWVLF
tara:strand:- start:130 stop:315 length:186 start_codon:yes stop_codon:yes gene_type:complete